ncbi:hypothetical protein [Asticcacaulis biprosthecium]|uniref:hypothetical protein n=1 Tax=Asticcacaulis biprosthecium TaxID=76891 RepID=UPI00058AC23C|nr:hypothetical protein [Asticcacaulis biprosthecium]
MAKTFEFGRAMLQLRPNHGVICPHFAKCGAEFITRPFPQLQNGQDILLLIGKLQSPVATQNRDQSAEFDKFGILLGSDFGCQHAHLFETVAGLGHDV